MSLDQVANGRFGAETASKVLSTDDGRLDAHVVILNNYVRAHHVASYVKLAARVRKLTVLLSVPAEPHRPWDTEWADLDVRVQKSWMVTGRWKHSAGFSEPNYIHIPLDTTWQLKSLKPDIVFSYEMGTRTLMSSWFRRFNTSVPLVMVGNMSGHIEKERGFLRRIVRAVVRKGVDYFTYNGPSCYRYLKSLSIPDDKMFHLPYCIDSAKVFTGDREVSSGPDSDVLRLINCGAMSERKGVLPFAQCLKKWCIDNPERKVEFSIAGSGELQAAIAQCSTKNLTIKFLGHRDSSELRTAYGESNICVFPTLADEWGLVPIEALASGLPVLGSAFAQSVEAEVRDGKTGWVFDPPERASMYEAIDRAMKCSPAELVAMGQRGRESVAHISGEATAEKFCQIISTVRPDSVLPGSNSEKSNNSNKKIPYER